MWHALLCVWRASTPKIDSADKNYFTGLASPAAAAILASTVWVCHDLGWVGNDLPHEVAVLVGILTATVGFLMIANFPYYSFKGIDLRRRVPFVVMIAVVLIFGLITLDPPSVLLVGSLIYALSGPVMQEVKRRKRQPALIFPQGRGHGTNHQFAALNNRHNH